MGFYLNQNSKGETLPTKGKAAALIADGATVLSGGDRPEFCENMIVVVDNGAWDAAAYAYDYQEYNRFVNGRAGRPVTWLTHPLAKELSNYKD